MGWGGHAPQADPNIATAEQQQVALEKQQEDFYEQNVAPQALKDLQSTTDTDNAAVSANTDLANYQLGISKQLSDQYQNFVPVINQVASDAMQGDSDAYQQSMVDRAVTDAGQQYASTNAGLQRDLAARGINPGSGDAIAAMAGSRDAEALGRTQAANQTRLAARQMGWTQAVTAAGLGTTLQQGGINTSVAAGNSFNNAVNASADTINALGAVSGISNNANTTASNISSNLGQLGLSAWQTALQRNQISDSLKNSLMGGVAGGASTAAGGMAGKSMFAPAAAAPAGGAATAGGGAAALGAGGGMGAAGGADAMAAMAVMA